MKLEDQVKELTELMAELIPTVDRLAHNQKKNTEAINLLTETTSKAFNQISETTSKAFSQIAETSRKTNLEMSEMRFSNMSLAEAIEKLVIKIDKIDQFEERLIRIEHTLFK